jgi:hypothetical protein
LFHHRKLTACIPLNSIQAIHQFIDLETWFELLGCMTAGRINAEMRVHVFPLLTDIFFTFSLFFPPASQKVRCWTIGMRLSAPAAALPCTD